MKKRYSVFLLILCLFLFTSCESTSNGGSADAVASSLMSSTESKRLTSTMDSSDTITIIFPLQGD